jgi:tRNA dimethylallyltransferase
MEETDGINLITITGPTASGKTLFAANLAYHLNGEIISADSRQVYRQMDIGTGKDYGDYWVNGEQIPSHLVDIHDPGYNYNVYEYQKDFLKAFNDISSRNKMPMLVGGTGLYIQSVLEGYFLINVPVNEELRKKIRDLPKEELAEMLKSVKPGQHNSTDLTSMKRMIRAIEIAEYYRTHPHDDKNYPRIKSIIFGIKHDWYNRRKKITERLRIRLESGLVEEVESLLKIISPEDLIYYGLEYKYVTLYLTNQLSYQEMAGQLETAIHQLAKRQMTWFRKMERSDYKIWWIDADIPIEEKLREAFDILKDNGAAHLIHQR